MFCFVFQIDQLLYIFLIIIYFIIISKAHPKFHPLYMRSWVEANGRQSESYHSCRDTAWQVVFCEYGFHSWSVTYWPADLHFSICEWRRKNNRVMCWFWAKWESHRGELASTVMAMLDSLGLDLANCRCRHVIIKVTCLDIVMGCRLTWRTGTP